MENPRKARSDTYRTVLLAYGGIIGSAEIPKAETLSQEWDTYQAPKDTIKLSIESRFPFPREGDGRGWALPPFAVSKSKKRCAPKRKGHRRRGYSRSIGNPHRRCGCRAKAECRGLEDGRAPFFAKKKTET